jgi:putative glycosyltransferase
MNLSIVTTLYHSAPWLREFYVRARAAAETITREYEIIFVNDGSPDNSLEAALAIYEEDARVRVIDLSRNFGHHKAIMTGLAQARGDLIFLVDADLEEEPELLTLFYERLREMEADVVYGVQQARKGRVFERLTGALFYKLFGLLSAHHVPANQLTARLMTRDYVSSLVAHKEQEIFLVGLWAITGFRQVPVSVVKHDKGHSTYDLRRKIAIFVNALTSFSSKPLVYIFYLGCAIIFLSGAAALYLIFRSLFFGHYLAGWPSLIVSIWLLGGLTIFCIGIVGIYLSKVFVEAKQRPYTIIRRLYERAEDARAAGSRKANGEQYEEVKAPVPEMSGSLRRQADEMEL